MHPPVNRIVIPPSVFGDLPLSVRPTARRHPAQDRRKLDHDALVRARGESDSASGDRRFSLNCWWRRIRVESRWTTWTIWMWFSL